MENVLKYFKFGVACLGTGLTWLFGAWDTALMVLVCFIVLDYVMGLTRAYINKEVSSNIGFKGIAKKAVILIVLIVAVLLDKLLNSGTYVFRTLVCYFYICNEGISLLENCAALGVPIPSQLKEVLSQLKEGEKKGAKL